MHLHRLSPSRSARSTIFDASPGQLIRSRPAPADRMIRSSARCGRRGGDGRGWRRNRRPGTPLPRGHRPGTGGAQPCMLIFRQRERDRHDHRSNSARNIPRSGRCASRRCPPSNPGIGAGPMARPALEVFSIQGLNHVGPHDRRPSRRCSAERHTSCPAPPGGNRLQAGSPQWPR